MTAPRDWDAAYEAAWDELPEDATREQIAARAEDIFAEWLARDMDNADDCRIEAWLDREGAA